MDAEQCLAREGPAEPVAQQPMERADAERPHRQPLDALRTERLLESRLLRSVDEPPGEQQEHVVRGEPSQRERECVRRRVVEPLNVVDREEKGRVLGEQLQCTANRHPERPRIDPVPRRLFAEERDLERSPPRRRQRRQHVVEDVLEQIAQPHVSEAALGLGRSRREDAQSLRARMLDAASQSVDFPMPASPSSTSAAGPPSASPMKAWREASSSSLLTSSNTTRVSHSDVAARSRAASKVSMSYESSCLAPLM